MTTLLQLGLLYSMLLTGQLSQVKRTRLTRQSVLKQKQENAERRMPFATTYHPALESTRKSASAENNF